MLLRIKVVKCADIVLDIDEISDTAQLINYLKKMCGEDTRTYIHLIERTPIECIDQKLLFKGTLREVQPDRLSPYYQ